ncbi:unnamed protein product [Thlaspi arvense]|uniref:DUF4283 domain-containing protein n=1 Tax=Thlaspi arvense TaxID=13288 RepID=A0AAU9RBS2_THLAR|nr:unnamed protein product [Thlaspi arvense]
MFTVTQWNSTGGSVQDLDAITIWAHLQGMPFNLMHRKGISLVAGLIGEPIERDEYTMNLVSLTEAHVKVEVNLTKPLPTSVEVSRDDGSITEIKVVYPWVPPTCSNCQMLGHVARYCPALPLATNAVKKSGMETLGKDKKKGKVSHPPAKPPVSDQPADVSSSGPDRSPKASSVVPPPASLATPKAPTEASPTAINTKPCSLQSNPLFELLKTPTSNTFAVLDNTAPNTTISSPRSNDMVIDSTSTPFTSSLPLESSPAKEINSKLF